MLSEANVSHCSNGFCVWILLNQNWSAYLCSLKLLYHRNLCLPFKSRSFHLILLLLAHRSTCIFNSHLNILHTAYLFKHFVHLNSLHSFHLILFCSQCLHTSYLICALCFRTHTHICISHTHLFYLASIKASKSFCYFVVTCAFFLSVSLFIC